MPRYLLLSVIFLLLNGCATAPPLDLTGIDHAVTVPRALDEPDKIGTRILWGGMILSGQNFKEYTRLEILAYPIDHKGYLNQQAEPLGRFYAHVSGYLETAEYAPQRWVTLVGTFSALQDGIVGNAPYTYPVMQVRQIYLWSEQAMRDSRTRFHFGIGVTIH